MDITDFEDPFDFATTDDKIENGLGFSWCIKAKMMVPNLYIAAQAKGYVDFYLDGKIEYALEVVLNGDKMDEHARRLLTAQYLWPNNAILNFQLSGHQIVLPSKKTKYKHELHKSYQPIILWQQNNIS